MERAPVVGQVATHARRAHQQHARARHRLRVLRHRVVLRGQDVQRGPRRGRVRAAGRHVDGAGQARRPAHRQRLDRRDHRRDPGRHGQPRPAARLPGPRLQRGRLPRPPDARRSRPHRDHARRRADGAQRHGGRHPRRRPGPLRAGRRPGVPCSRATRSSATSATSGRTCRRRRRSASPRAQNLAKVSGAGPEGGRAVQPRQPDRRARPSSQAPAGSPLRQEPRLADMTPRRRIAAAHRRPASRARASSCRSRARSSTSARTPTTRRRSSTRSRPSTTPSRSRTSSPAATATRWSIVTADHECAGFSIVEPGTFTNAEATVAAHQRRPRQPGQQRHGRSGRCPARSTRRAPTARSTARANDPDELRAGDLPHPGRRRRRCSDGDDEASLWLTYLSGNHTGEDVPLFSTGPGSRRFAAASTTPRSTSKMFAVLDGLSGTHAQPPGSGAAPAVRTPARRSRSAPGEPGRQLP